MKKTRYHILVAPPEIVVVTTSAAGSSRFLPVSKGVPRRIMQRMMQKTRVKDVLLTALRTSNGWLKCAASCVGQAVSSS